MWLGKKEAMFNYNESSEKLSILGMERQITKYLETWLCVLRVKHGPSKSAPLDCLLSKMIMCWFGLCGKLIT